MNRDETKSLLKLIFLAYPNFEIPSEKVDLWSSMLTDAVFSKAKSNAEQHIKTNRYAPTIAEIRAGACERIIPPEDPQVTELRRRRGELE